MDVSDGLIGDLAKLLAASRIAGRIEAARVPLSAAARAAVAAEPALFETALTGGDDYEILAVMPEERLDAFGAVATAAGVGVTVLGRTFAGEGLTVEAADGTPMVLEHQSFSHF
jgi:thiamine-monophosphate kinase